MCLYLLLMAVLYNDCYAAYGVKSGLTRNHPWNLPQMVFVHNVYSGRTPQLAPLWQYEYFPVSRELCATHNSLPGEETLALVLTSSLICHDSKCKQ